MKITMKKIMALIIACIFVSMHAKNKEHAIDTLETLFAKAELGEVVQGDVILFNKARLYIDDIFDTTEFKFIDLSRLESDSWIQKFYRTKYTLKAQKDIKSNSWQLVGKQHCALKATEQAYNLGFSGVLLTLVTLLSAYSLWS